MVTYDEAKRRANIKNHGLDFVGVEAIFDHPVVSQEDDRQAYGEQRINVLGLLDGQIVSMTCTERGDTLRVISLRKATRHEARYYTQALAR